MVTLYVMTGANSPSLKEGTDMIIKEFKLGMSRRIFQHQDQTETNGLHFFPVDILQKALRLWLRILAGGREMISQLCMILTRGDLLKWPRAQDRGIF